MKYAILSDIHANLKALAAVLDDSNAQKCTHYVCLGDIVGYGGKPKECSKIIRDTAMKCVKGNVDEYCSSETTLDRFPPKSAIVVEWTREQLNEADREWLRNLPFVAKADGFTLVHATLDTPQRWQYIFNTLDAEPSFFYQETSVCFFGHTHVPLAFVREASPTGNQVRGGTYSKFKVDPSKKYFVNVGSVGQPRDNNPKAAYVVYDMDEATIELRRVDYDIAGAQNDIPPENRN